MDRMLGCSANAEFKGNAIHITHSNAAARRAIRTSFKANP